MASLQQELFEFNELCRICANKTNGLLALSIFGGDDGTNKDIFKKINVCLPIQIDLQDKLPKLICGECVCKLDLLNEFRDISRRTEQFLLDLLNRIFEHNVEPLLQDVDYTLVSEEDGTLEQPLADKNDMKQGSIATKTTDNIAQKQPVHSPELNDPIDIRSPNAANNKVESIRTNITIDGATYLVTAEPLEGNTYFICVLCSKTFADRDSFDSHCAEIHWSKCEPCSLLFTSQEAYSMHCSDIHSQDKQSTPHPADSSVLLSHMETYGDLPQHTVQYAPILSNGHVIGTLTTQVEREELATSQDELNEPSALLSPSTMNEENLSEKDMERSEDFSEDVEPPVYNEHPCKTETASCNIQKNFFKCSECKIYLSSQSQYKFHKAFKCKEKPYQCFKCTKRFRSKIGVKQHEVSHTGVYDFECNECGKGFASKSYLITHQRIHNVERRFKCSQCDMRFKSKQSMLNHVNRHMGVRPYKCSECDKSFTTKGVLQNHINIHSGTTRQHPCPICKKMFVSRSYLTRHMFIHTGNKPHICEFCSKGFLTKLDLKIHRTLHTGEKSFVCETCGKAFARRDALKCHERVHTGERPYSCNVCSKRFTQFTPMAIHKRLHTGEKPYTCSLCGEKYNSRPALLSHEKRIHPKPRSDVKPG